MIKVILSGCNGKMGRVLVRLIQSQENMTIVAGIDPFAEKFENDFPVYKDPNLCKESGDVVIDFSHHTMIPKLLEYCLNTHTPLMIATTGLEEKELADIKKASASIPILQTGNTSLGVNVMADLAKKAASSLEESFDIEIIEKHHNQKIDAPSGTAYLIANAINDGLSKKKDFIYGREGRNAKREDEIGIHAIRGGSIVGEHTVIFAGPDEIIEIKHTALSKDIFGLGAIKAAKFLLPLQNGLYSMNDIFK